MYSLRKDKLEFNERKKTKLSGRQKERHYKEGRGKVRFLGAKNSPEPQNRCGCNLVWLLLLNLSGMVGPTGDRTLPAKS